MIRKRIYLYSGDQYKSPTLGGFVPFLEAYLHEEMTKESIIVVPGGAYMMVAAGEAEPVAEKMFAWNYDVYVLCYTCALFSGQPVYKQPLRDLAKAVSIIKKQEKKEKICLCGFSAGGNLVATFTGHINDPDIQPECEGAGTLDDALLVDAQILGYPVITAGPGTHKDTIMNLWGQNPDKGQLDYSSAEKNVNSDTPVTFLWHTATDADVSVENSFLYARSLKEGQVPYTLHIFSKGPHGLSVSDEKWAAGEYGSFYSMDQFFKQMQFMIDHQDPEKTNPQLPPIGTDYEAMFMASPKDYLKADPNPEVAIWMDMAKIWLDECMRKQENRVCYTEKERV